MKLDSLIYFVADLWPQYDTADIAAMAMKRGIIGPYVYGKGYSPEALVERALHRHLDQKRQAQNA